jgi:hypothetical protein
MSTSWTEKLRQALGLEPGESKYSPVNQDGALEKQQETVSSRKRLAAKIAASVLFVWLLLFVLYKWGTSDSRHSALGEAEPIKSNFFHLVIPASSAGFCRTLFSAGALNYPTPRIVNWEKEFKDPEKLDGGFHLAKIEGVLDFLQKLDDSHRHELVYIPDGLDTWFQLRPEVLIQRYNAIRKRLEKRTWPRYGLSYDQSIIFSAQNSCSSEEDSWPCSLVPSSDIPEGAYEPGMARPRYLGTGSIMGNAGALKSLFEHAKWKTEQRKYASDQEVFSEIFGDQEYYREFQLATNPRANSVIDENDPRNGKVDPNAVELPCGNCQFGIGLDYWGEISTATADAGEDLIPINLANTTSYRHLDLTRDINESTPPFWTPDYSGDTSLPQKTWSEISLQTHRQSGVRPVSIHHGAGSNDIHSAWRQNWHFPHLRTLASAHAKSMRIPFAVATDTEGQVREYWGPNDGFGGARVHDPEGLPGQWKQWDELCAGDEVGESIFGDGLGAYKCPIYYLYFDSNKQKDQLAKWQERQDEAKRKELRDRAGLVAR